MQALRDDVALPEGALRRRLVVGVALVVLGVASIVAGFAGEGSSGLSLIGLGMLLVLGLIWAMVQGGDLDPGGSASRGADTAGGAPPGQLLSSARIGGRDRFAI